MHKSIERATMRIKIKDAQVVYNHLHSRHSQFIRSIRQTVVVFSSYSLEIAFKIPSFAGHPFFLNRSCCLHLKTSTSAPAFTWKIFTVTGYSSTSRDATSAVGFASLTKRIAASLSCSPPSQLEQNWTRNEFDILLVGKPNDTILYYDISISRIMTHVIIYVHILF